MDNEGQGGREIDGKESNRGARYLLVRPQHGNSHILALVAS